MPEMLGFADAPVRVAKRGFREIEHPKGGLAVGVDPIPKVLKQLVLEDRLAFAPAAPAQAPSARPMSRRSAASSLLGVRPRRARARAASNRAAFFGDRSR